MANRMTIRCGFSGCNKYFSSEKDLVHHKIQDPDHEYCHRCKLDFDTEEEMDLHLIVSEKHLACPYCATEFKSVAGLTTHMMHSHRASADLVCVGCNLKFVRASHYMAHIEKGECPILTRQLYELQRAQKRLIKDTFQIRLNEKGNEESPAFPPPVDSVADTEDGGVPLNLMDGENVLSSDFNQKPGSRNILEERQDELNSNASRNPQPCQREYITANQDWPELGGPAYQNNADQSAPDEDLIDMNSRVFQNPRYKWNESAGVSTSHRLFPTAKAAPPPPPPPPPQSVFGSRAHTDTEFALKEDTNDLRLRSPSIATGMSTSTKYDVWSFYDGVLGKFLCPARKCVRRYDTAKDFQMHLIGPAHTGGSARCPLCFRYFDTTYSLVAHCESSTIRCKIRESANFNQILREITGDLIGTEGHHKDGSIRYVADPNVLPPQGERPAGF